MNHIMGEGMVTLLVRTAEDQAEGGIILPTLKMLRLQAEAGRRRRRKIRKIGGQELRMLIRSRKRAPGGKRKKRRANP